jgi:hypothetical protein
MSANEGTEFERFGPWIDAVRTEDDVPRLFRDAGLDLSAIRAAIKIPRDIERRLANPSMDLYDHLLAIGSDTLTILTRVGSEYTRASVAIADVVAVEEGANLLDGRLALHTADGGTTSLSFNGSSRASMVAFIDLLRPGAPASSARRLGDGRRDLRRGDLGENGDGVIASFRDATRAQPGLRAIAASSTESARTSSTFGGLIDRIRPRVLQPTVLATDERQLVLFSRTRSIADARQPDVSELRRLVDVDRLRTITLRPHPRYGNATIATLHVAAAEIEVVAPTRSELIDALEGLGRDSTDRGAASPR